jgi:hypothetical protein
LTCLKNPDTRHDIDEVEQRLHAFERLYEQTARPFQWMFTRHDLTKLMKRLADKEAALRSAA